MVVQLFCVCDVYCTVYVYGTLIWFIYIPYRHTFGYQSYKLMEYQECCTGVIVEAQHYMILSGPDMPMYC
jgi:hypothetical protein